MYCSKCGSKIDKGASFCIKCGKKAGSQEKPGQETKEVKPTTNAKKAKVSIPLLLAPKLKKIIILSITILLILTGGYFLFKKFIKKQPDTTPASFEKEKPSQKKDSLITSEEEKEEAETPNKSSTPIITDEYIESKKQQRKAVETNYSFLKDIEFLHIKEAFDKAADWDKNAQLYKYYLLIDNDPEKKPYINFNFFSPNQDEQFKITWYPTGKLKTEAEKDKYFDGQPLIEFPPLISLEEAIDLAIEKLKQITPIPITVKSFSFILSEDNDYIWTSITAVTTKKSESTSCNIYFTREVKCNMFSSQEK